MSRRCLIMNKGVQTGNNVSHAHNKTRRRFLPNLQTVFVFSETLKRSFRMRISVHGMRTIDHKGGLDKFLLSTANGLLSMEALKIKKLITKTQKISV